MPKTPTKSDLTPSGKAFYHLYVCVQEDCKSAANPNINSQHQRGLHTFSASPLPLVKCPGCGKPMQIAKQVEIIRKYRPNPLDGYTEEPQISDLIYSSPGQESAAELDELNLEKENA